MKKIRLVCPACIRWRASYLVKENNYYTCPQESCLHKYEIKDGIAVLLTKSGDSLNINKRKNLKMRPNFDGIH
jgi:uncharacterized protein YbaR (Trm112 family)